MKPRAYSWENRALISPGSYEETFIKSVPPKGASKVDHEVIHFPF